MVNKRFLVPFDISEYSLAAANEAIDLAELLDASINFIHIVEPEPYSEIVYDSQAADRIVEDEIKENANKWFSQMTERCAKKKVANKMEVLFERGSVVKTITDYAKNISADIIIIGHSSAHGFGRWLKGDIAKAVIDHAHAPCSVLVVKR
jgi:nucleotide-binding universal stress UspA family protein